MGIEFLQILLTVLFSVLWQSLQNEDQKNNYNGTRIKGIKMRKMVGILFASILSFILAMIFANIK